MSAFLAVDHLFWEAPQVSALSIDAAQNLQAVNGRAGESRTAQTQLGRHSDKPEEYATLG